MKKYLSYNDALSKLRAYCAYQDRCHKEVRNKLLSYEIYGDDLENIIVDLIQEKFLDEQRYTNSFVSGKFRYKKWGRLKIKQHLNKNNISSYCIQKALESEIEESDYMQVLETTLRKKNELLSEKNFFKKRSKLIQYAINKGFEMELVQEVARKLIPQT